MLSFVKISLLLLVGGALCVPFEERASKLERRADIVIQDFPSNVIKCATYPFLTDDIRIAIEKAVDLKAKGETHGANKYPENFGNIEKVEFNPKCTGQLLEYPIMEGGKNPYNGGKNNRKSKAHRVVFQIETKGSKATFCGLMTHIGAKVENGFVACKPVDSFTPGRCRVHVVQHQKPNPVTDSYHFDIEIKDDKGETIGGRRGVDGRSPFSVTSLLPWTLEVESGRVDADPIRFKYSNQAWSSSDKSYCKFGGYENGDREGDCSFSC